MEQGTYLQCTKCNKTNNCCCNFEKIDRPIISKDEKEKIELCYINNDNKKLFQELTNECFNINTINNKCIFYDGKCKIYNNRPYDCRLYPYDIKKINEKFFLVLYKLDCIEYENFFENVGFLIEKIKPFINTFTDINYNSKLNELEYTIIKEIYI